MTIQTEEILETAHEIADRLSPFVISEQPTEMELSSKEVQDLYHMVMNFIVINEADDLPREIRKAIGQVA